MFDTQVDAVAGLTQLHWRRPSENRRWKDFESCASLPVVRMSAPQQPGSVLTREGILRALSALSDTLGREGVTGEVCLFGGTVMVLAFNARLSTKHLDAIFHPTQSIRDAARRIAEEQGLPADWLNDGVKGYLSSRHDTTAGNLPQFPHLRLTMPVKTQYLVEGLFEEGKV